MYDLAPTPDGGFVGVGFLQARPPDTTGPQSLWLFKTDQYGHLAPGGPTPSPVVCPPVGVAEAAAVGGGIDVYPNPSADGRFVVRVSASAGPAGRAARLVVFDAVGRVVWRGAATAAETAVDLRRHAPGLYSLRLTWPDGRAVSRRVVITP